MPFDSINDHDHSDGNSGGETLSPDSLSVNGVDSDLHWTEDGNSPATFSGATSHTYTLSGTYDLVKVIINDLDGGGTQATFAIQVNGDSGSNYSYITNGGSSVSGDSSVQFLSTRENATMGALLLSGRWNYNFNMTNLMMTWDGSQAAGARNDNVSSPLNQFTILNTDGTSPANISLDINVYGYDGA